MTSSFAIGLLMAACLDASWGAKVPRLDHTKEDMVTKCRFLSAKLLKALVSRLISSVSNLALDYSESMALKEVELVI